METIKNRRSIRKYKNKEIPAPLLDELLETAARAQTMGNLQLYSVVVTRDEAMKERLAPAHFNQPMVKGAPVVLTFCADFNRTSQWCRCTHACLEVVAVLLSCASVFSIVEKLLGLKGSHTCINYYISGEIKNTLKKTGCDIKHQTNSRGESLEIPDVRNGCCKFNVTHSLTAHLLGGYLNSALLADLALEADSLILSAMAFPVFSRAKDPFAEKTVGFRFKSTVIDCFSLSNLAVRP